MRTKMIATATVMVLLVAGASLFAFSHSRPTVPPPCRGGVCCAASEKSNVTDECCLECLQCCALDGCCEECLQCCLAMGCGDCFVSEATVNGFKK